MVDPVLFPELLVLFEAGAVYQDVDSLRFEKTLQFMLPLPQERSRYED
jgi:hypothetical protein